MLDKVGTSMRRITFFFFTDTATTEIYTLSLHDALPIYGLDHVVDILCRSAAAERTPDRAHRSEEHTSELQSQFHLVCRLLLEKKKKRYHGHGLLSADGHGGRPRGRT